LVNPAVDRLEKRLRCLDGDRQKNSKKKLDVDFRNYKILGVQYPFPTGHNRTWWNHVAANIIVQEDSEEKPNYCNRPRCLVQPSPMLNWRGRGQVG
jgi:hypothetical protein